MYKNHIDLIGFIGSDPEAHSTSNGIAVTNFSLATKSSWKNEAGPYDSRTEWHRIVLGASWRNPPRNSPKALMSKSKANSVIAATRKKSLSARKPSQLISRSQKFMLAFCAGWIDRPPRTNRKSPKSRPNRAPLVLFNV